MSKRKIVGILIMLGGIVIFGFLIYFLFSGNNKKMVDNINKEINILNKKSISVQKNQEQNLEPTKNEAKKIIAHKEEKFLEEQKNDEEENLKFKAASFAERFGSFSNQSNFQNLMDLKIFMSDKMKKWADAYVTKLRQEQLDDSNFYSIVTKAITEEVQDVDVAQGKATILVHTIRNEQKDKQINRFNQDILIKFIRERKIWKVDSANWQ